MRPTFGRDGLGDLGLAGGVFFALVSLLPLVLLLAVALLRNGIAGLTG
jgi:hypothetical protein